MKYLGTLWSANSLAPMRTLTVAATIALCCVGSYASPITYGGTLVGPSLGIRFDNNLGWTDLSLVQAETGIQIDVDPTALTLNYDLIQYQTSATTTSFSENLSSGFGTSSQYQITLVFSPMTIDFESAAGDPDLLSPGSTGTYHVVGNATASGLDNGLNNRTAISSAGFGTNVLAGIYTVAGPQTTINGTFNLPIGAPWQNSMTQADLATSGYPSSLAMTFPANSGELMEFQTDLTFVDRFVDGAEVKVSENVIVPSAGSDAMSPGVLVSDAPEPSTVQLLGLGAVLCFVGLLRRRNSV